MILTVEDFKVAPFELILTPIQSTDLGVLIQEVEDEYLPILFGLELYDLFIADLDVSNRPTTARFVKVFEPFNDQTDDLLLRSKGILYMLKALVYFQYVRLLPNIVTAVGIKTTKSNNSVDVTPVKFDLVRRYNDGIEVLKTIQYYMCEVDPSNYPEYKGSEVEFSDVF